VIEIPLEHGELVEIGQQRAPWRIDFRNHILLTRTAIKRR
jgi:hypothetical protein